MPDRQIAPGRTTQTGRDCEPAPTISHPIQTWLPGRSAPRPPRWTLMLNLLAGIAEKIAGDGQ